MRRAWLALPTLLLVAGCGGASGSKSGNPSTAAPASPQTLKVSEKEFSITPATVAVKPGTYSLQITNAGKIGHALEVEGPGVETKTATIAPGASASLSVTLSKPGK